MQGKYRFIIFLLLVIACKQVYEPPAITAPNHYLVVEGVINTQPNSQTVIHLSRTNNLVDTFLTNPESRASVTIESQGGGVFPLQERAGSDYVSGNLTLSQNELYRLNIRTSDGSQYLSDFVPVKQTPPIDSLTWKQEEDVTIYANAHDPTNNARYYRWDFVETWQYRSYLESNYGLGVANGHIFFKDSNTQTTNCWHTAPSTEVVLASSIRLTDDVIDHNPVAVLPKNSEKLGIRYSTVVRQYALTEEAYTYWDILRKNSQTLGTLFDAQPGQLQSNIRNTANAAEPVIGYVSACAVQEKRLFIDQLELFDWKPPVPSLYCGELAISQDANDPFLWNFPDTTYEPWYFISPSGIMIAKKQCVDCRLQGGTNQKPAFWQ